MLIRFVCWLLNRKRISTIERQQLTTQILKSIDALPLHSILTVDGQKLFIRGVPLDGERAVALRESADQAVHNQALAFIHEQVLYEAVSQGVHIALTTEQMNFAKAAIWYGQREKELLTALSTGDNTELLG